MMTSSITVFASAGWPATHAFAGMLLLPVVRCSSVRSPVMTSCQRPFAAVNAESTAVFGCEPIQRRSIAKVPGVVPLPLPPLFGGPAGPVAFFPPHALATSAAPTRASRRRATICI
jgi:hypothetical protein